MQDFLLGDKPVFSFLEFLKHFTALLSAQPQSPGVWAAPSWANVFLNDTSSTWPSGRKEATGNDTLERHPRERLEDRGAVSPGLPRTGRRAGARLSLTVTQSSYWALLRARSNQEKPGEAHRLLPTCRRDLTQALFLHYSPRLVFYSSGSFDTVLSAHHLFAPSDGCVSD